MAARVFVRNTFLDIDEPASPTASSRCVRRARSDESSHSRCRAECQRTEEQLEQLSRLLQEASSTQTSTKSATPTSTPPEQQQPQEASAAPELAELKRLQGLLGAALAGSAGSNMMNEKLAAQRGLFSKLAMPGSNSSISTMVPTDDLVEFELVEEADESESFSAAAAPWNYASAQAWQPQQPSQFQQQQAQMQKPSITINGRRVHQSSPKNVNLAEEFAKTEQTDRPTTMMIRNIPNAYTQTQLIAELGELGFKDSYDFLYLPMDKNTAASIGYAFVNFLDADWAERCKTELEGYRFKSQRRGCCKIATVSVAHLQGLEKNLAHYENTEVRAARRRQRRPVVVGHAAWRSTA
eukprot:TRINITY_DN28834_c1_g4_i1.p1 TRINITY_DN28834_c1_g4~~TRINITY_DN28834_c1_g4_i1.p1  ORF type:complete len:375 (-),score=100.80 TRINITY_DN28834_c1_g4_i1:125-1183(-)